MKILRSGIRVWLLLLALLPVSGAVPVDIARVVAPHGMVVAGHPQATQAGLAILQGGGNAVDAAVAVSLALGVAEPYGSGLGGKLMLLYYDAATGETHAVEALDQAASLDLPVYLRRPGRDRNYGYGSVCLPGLAAGLWLAHEKWGRLPWADNVAPSIRLARDGFEILPKTRAFFAEQETKLRQGDPEIARLYLPDGALPVVGSHLPNPDLANTLALLARHGRDGFYRGPVAEALLAASRQGGGVLSSADLAGYEARLKDPVGIDFLGYRLLASPAPTSGPPFFLLALKALEHDPLAGGELRSAANLALVGRVWREVYPVVRNGIADVPGAPAYFDQLMTPESIAGIRARANQPVPAGGEGTEEAAVPVSSTTHFLVADAAGNIVCVTQSLSLHFGAGVVPPGTGVVLNNSMSNFDYRDPANVNYIAPGKRPRSTIAPTIVLRAGRPVFAIGVPGGSRIPTAMLQVLLDRLVFDRPLAEAIGDTRIHWDSSARRDGEETIEAEASLPAATSEELHALGWNVERMEPAGTGIHFGGINAIEINPDGGYTGLADSRRTNAAAGY